MTSRYACQCLPGTFVVEGARQGSHANLVQLSALDRLPGWNRIVKRTKPLELRVMSREGDPADLSRSGAGSRTGWSSGDWYRRPLPVLRSRSSRSPGHGRSRVGDLRRCDAPLRRSRGASSPTTTRCSRGGSAPQPRSGPVRSSVHGERIRHRSLRPDRPPLRARSSASTRPFAGRLFSGRSLGTQEAQEALTGRGECRSRGASSARR